MKKYNLFDFNQIQEVNKKTKINNAFDKEDQECKFTWISKSIVSKKLLTSL
ncbi:hypothetical protein NPA08_03825 [Mycoplasmopsis citelli]|uniref:hypothetical protein n=1 Tax=Mycoplasmopsis citelli TaxID=171281 RepID=UPI0013ED81DD|nr:hypothetical protein [Mycoplasmopsis citelli]UUD36055.1 hypothetical protein NPA08_03825 [Mycoplasmopsis citelli]